MKKLTYVLAATLLAACNSGNNGYTITGTVEGANDGDMVYLQGVEGRQLVKLDSAVIKNGTFTFTGKQDTAVNRYLTYKNNEDNGMAMDFFLENGKIAIQLTKDSDAATGTPNNDAYQEIRTQLNSLMKQMETLYSALSDTTLTDEQREAKGKEIEGLQEKMIGVAKDGIAKNITNPVGIHLLKQNYYYMDVNELDPLGEKMLSFVKNFGVHIIILKRNENLTQRKIKGMMIAAPGERSFDGRPWEIVRGIYCPDRRLIVAGEELLGMGKRSVMRHEFGHAFDNAFTKRNQRRLPLSVQLWNSFAPTRKALPSEYASTNPAEYFAESESA